MNKHVFFTVLHDNYYDFFNSIECKQALLKIIIFVWSNARRCLTIVFSINVFDSVFTIFL